MITHASTFSGIGAPEVAAAMLGWENVFHCEINPFGRRVLDYYFPKAKSYEDITRTDFSEWRDRISVLTGGFPCQPFSYAGRRRGSQDDRYLWPFMLRCIEQVRPRWFVGENVAGITTMAFPSETIEVGNSGNLFGESDSIIEGRERYVLHEIIRNLENEGYSVQPFLIPACAGGAPHRRDRIFIVAHRNYPPQEFSTSDSNCSHGAGRESGEIRGEKEEERIQERNEICKSRESNPIRSEVQITPTNTDGNRLTTSNRSGGRERTEVDTEQQVRLLDGTVRPCSTQSTTDTASRQCRTQEESQGTQADRSERLPQQSKRGDETKRTNGLSPVQGHNTGRECHQGDGQEERVLPNSECVGRTTRRDDSREPSAPQQEERGEQQLFRTDGSFIEGMLPENRWRDFPTQSPVYRGNDGIPFDVDSLTIPWIKSKNKEDHFDTWKRETIKAYGNAIVVQVMYEIFQAIDKIEKQTLARE